MEGKPAHVPGLTEWKAKTAQWAVLSVVILS
jgi:hypothetical protein